MCSAATRAAAAFRAVRYIHRVCAGGWVFFFLERGDGFINLWGRWRFSMGIGSMNFIVKSMGIKKG